MYVHISQYSSPVYNVCMLLPKHMLNHDDCFSCSHLFWISTWYDLLCPSLSLSLSLSHTHTPISSPFFGSDRCSMVSLPTSAKVRKNVFFVITTALYYFLCFLSSLQKRWVTVAGAPSLHHKLKSLLVEVVGVTVASLDPTSRRSTAPWRELYTLREWTHPYWYDDNIIYYNMCITGILKISKVTLKI